MQSILLCLAALVVISPPPQKPDQLDRREFVSLMHSLFEECRTVSFVFEGERRQLSQGSGREAKIPTAYQGHYALRATKQQAGLLEIYKSVAPNPPEHISLSLLNGILDRSYRPNPSQILDPRRVLPPPSSGGPGSLNESPSPELFVYLWYFSTYGPQAPAEMIYEHLGWEDVAGHRCVKVRLSHAPLNVGTEWQDVMWIDLQRGGHPLKIESLYENNLIYTVDSIELRQTRTQVNDKLLWFPTQGTVNVFGSFARKSNGTLRAQEEYHVVLGSLQLNLPLDDSVFVVHTKPRRELHNSASIRADKPFDAAPARSPARPKTDAVSVQQRLDAHLATARRQAADVKASSPARNWWDRTTVVQGTLTVIGLGLLACGGFWYWRRR